ncbi:MAG: hypothetical protein IIX14_05785 [Clostridia bacterium]|nr:hypothetical protein [Clostridia bacterium]
MEIKTENTVAEPATLIQETNDKYDFVNMMHYRTSLALIKNLTEDGIFNDAEYRKICTMLNKKYGLSSNSIFAENA